MKIEKRFVLGDSTVNDYGFRLLTTGYQKQEYEKNPIGYFMHDRAAGVLVRWEDIKIENDEISANPNINDSHVRCQQTVNEINSGFLNGASFGNIVVLDSTMEQSMMLQGQTGPTITKWYNRECSLVDIPGNMNSLVLYDLNGNVVTLKALTEKSSKPQNTPENKPQQQPEPKADSNGNTDNANNLDKEKLINEAVKNKDITPESAKQLKESYPGTAADLVKLLQDFAKSRIEYLMRLPWKELDRANLLDELKNKYQIGFELKRFLEVEIKNNSWGNKNTDMKDFVKWADSNDKKIPVNLPSKLKDYVAGRGPDDVKDLILKRYKDEYNDFLTKSWEFFDKNNLSDYLKENYFEIFKTKYKEKFGVEYKDKAKK